MTWDTSKPRDSDLLSNLHAQWRSDKSALDNDGLRSLMWWGDSITSAGIMRFSTNSAHAACLFVVPRSQVSSRRDGDVFLVSDESRIVMATSAASVPLWSDKAFIGFQNPFSVDEDGDVSLTAFTSLVSNARVLVSQGTAALTTNGVANVAFGLTYSVVPHIAVTPGAVSPASAQSTVDFSIGITKLNASGMSVAMHYVGAGSAPGNYAIVRWRSSGTTAL